MLVLFWLPSIFRILCNSLELKVDMDHGKRRGLVQKSEERNENTSISKEAKVGLVDVAIAIVSIGQKDEVKRRWRFCKNLGTWDCSVGLFDTHWNIIHYQLLRSAFFDLLSSLNNSSVRIFFRLRHFARPASRKNEVRKIYLFALSALRDTRVLGHPSKTFTTKVRMVANYRSAYWLSYLRTQLKAFVDRDIFVSVVFSNNCFQLKQTLTSMSYNSKRI